MTKPPPPPPGCVIHLAVGSVGAFGLASHSYRRAACGVRAERWLTTDNTEWPEIENVTCTNCKRTKIYKRKFRTKVHEKLRGKVSKGKLRSKTRKKKRKAGEPSG